MSRVLSIARKRFTDGHMTQQINRHRNFVPKFYVGAEVEVRDGRGSLRRGVCVGLHPLKVKVSPTELVIVNER